MRRASPHLSIALLVATGMLSLAGAAAAQSARESAEARGLRYLSWQGRGEAPATAPASADPAHPTPVRTDLRRPNTVIPHGGFARAEAALPVASASAPPPVRRTLTPANAWLRPTATAPEYAPAPAAPPPPPPPPSPSPAPPRPQPRATPDYLPDQGPRGQPAPAEVVYATPAAAEVAPIPADPMAPRRDAPIFHMQRDPPPPAAAPADAVAARGEPQPDPRRALEAAASVEGPPRQGARYYSVHRQNGREPDALEMPAPNYVDALVVSSIDTIASQDLAEPAQGPTLIRNNDGSLRAAPASSDGDHQ